MVMVFFVGRRPVTPPSVAEKSKGVRDIEIIREGNKVGTHGLEKIVFEWKNSCTCAGYIRNHRTRNGC